MRHHELLEDIKNDRVSGAGVIARKAIKCVEILIKETTGCTFEELLAELDGVAAAILKEQPGMAQLNNFFNTIFDTIDQDVSGDLVGLSRKLSGAARRFHELSVAAVAKVAELGAELIEEDSQVFIYSNSSTIFEIIRKAHESGKVFQVILTEARPMNEGRACAKELAKLGIQCTYFVDAAASKGVERADIILLGADTISEIELVNKIGTKAICLLAREFVVPCYTACESSKFIPQKLGPRKEQIRNSSEVWNGCPPTTTVENYYFDEVSLELFNGIITEEGILSPQEIGSRILARPMNKRLLDILR